KHVFLVAAAALLGATAPEAATTTSPGATGAAPSAPGGPPMLNFGPSPGMPGSPRGNRHHEPERAWRPRPANLRRAAGQSRIGHLRSERRRTAQFGQLWVSNCPGPGVVGDGRQYPEHQRQRRDVAPALSAGGLSPSPLAL